MTMANALQSAFTATAHRGSARGVLGASIDVSSTRFRPYRAVALILALSQFSCPAIAQAQDTGDPSAGEKVFARCKGCHQVGEKARNGVGPQLNGIVGRASAAVADYRYSPAMQKANLTWDPATLQAFLQNPKAVVPGTKMATAGLTKATDFTNLVAYLSQFGPNGTAP